MGEPELDSALRLLDEGARALGLRLSARELSAFRLYLREILIYNRKVNLTAVANPEEIAVHHFVDSLTCVHILRGCGAEWVADVGTGAGFPGVPLKIVEPGIRLALIDSLGKRIAFLEHLVRVLGLEGVSLHHIRAEDAGRNELHRERYDFTVARAVAQLRVLAELCIPLVRVGGWFLAMKGPRGYDELKDAEGAISLLGGEVADVKELTLPIANETRVLILVRKKEPTPVKYPRRAGIPEKRPL